MRHVIGDRHRAFQRNISTSQYQDNQAAVLSGLDGQRLVVERFEMARSPAPQTAPLVRCQGVMAGMGLARLSASPSLRVSSVAGAPSGCDRRWASVARRDAIAFDCVLTSAWQYP